MRQRVRLVVRAVHKFHVTLAQLRFAVTSHNAILSRPHLRNNRPMWRPLPHKITFPLWLPIHGELLWIRTTASKPVLQLRDRPRLFHAKPDHIISSIPPMPPMPPMPPWP